jgi:CHAD domain-containing protein
MNSGFHSPNGRRAAVRRTPGHDEKLETWKGLLAHCGRRPSKKRVHALRVATLRILAELEFQVGLEGKGSDDTEAAARWIKLGEKLRHALGPVREADVWLDKLDRLRASLADTNGYTPRSNRTIFLQIDELEDRLKQKRRQWEKELAEEIESRSAELEEISQRMGPAAGHARGNGGATRGVGTPQIAKQFADVVKEFPTLDAGNLHEFRKSIKKVRYLAEIVATTDPEAGRQADSLRKIQSAIGEWHDWQALAKREDHAQGKREELTELLETLAAESLEKALAVCDRLTTSLLKSNYGPQDSSHAPPKKPPVRSEFFYSPSLRKSA